MEKVLLNELSFSKEQTVFAQQGLENLKADEMNLNAKIEKKKSELERRLKRLESLQGVRPAFMDELERLEVELQGYYNNFVVKFRNLSYLEHKLAEIKRIDQEHLDKTNEELKVLQSQFKEEEIGMMRQDDSNESISNKGIYVYYLKFDW